MASEFDFTPATKKGIKARIALEAPSGAGKTWTALLLAAKLDEGGGIGVLDTENQSASKYASEFTFRSMNLRPPFEPERYIKAIQAAERAGLDVLIIDSLSPEWDGAGGVRAIVDREGERLHGNKWAAWNVATPRHDALIQAILHSKLHVIATMRSKMETDQQTNSEGRKEIVKLGMKAIQREGFEYEFDIVCSMDLRHELIVTKTRCRALDKYRALEPDMADFAATVKAWLSDATPLERAPVAASPTGISRSDMIAVGRIASESKGLEGTPEREDGSVRPAAAPTVPTIKAPDMAGKALNETQLRILEEQFAVATDKDKAKRELVSLLETFGYNWQGFVQHGAHFYAQALSKVKAFDRSGYVREGAIADAHRAKA